MFKIKDLILEEVEKEKVREECKTYIQKNRELLEDDFHIWRVSGSGRGPHEIYYVPMRKRKSIKGNKVITYFFRKYKPSDVPNRRANFLLKVVKFLIDLLNVEHTSKYFL